MNRKLGRCKKNCLVFPKLSPLQHEIHTGTGTGLSLSVKQVQGIFLLGQKIAIQEMNTFHALRTCSALKNSVNRMLCQAHAGLKIFEGLMFPVIEQF